MPDRFTIRHGVYAVYIFIITHRGRKWIMIYISVGGNEINQMPFFIKI